MERSRCAPGRTWIVALAHVARRGLALIPAAILVSTFTVSPVPASQPAHSSASALPSSPLVAATTPANAAGGTRFSVGGAAAGTWAADPGPTSGSTYAYAFSNRVDTSRIARPAPNAIYQRSRFGTNFAYTVDSLQARGRYIVRLHFVEPSWGAERRRIFGVTLNGVAVLRRFDIFAAAGGSFRAVTRSFTTEASSTGAIAIAFSAVRDTAIVSGIEVARDAPPERAKVDVAATGRLVRPLTVDRMCGRGRAVGRLKRLG